MIISEKPIQKVSQVNQSPADEVIANYDLQIIGKINVLTWRYLQKYRPELFGRRVPRHKNNVYIKVKRRGHPFADNRGYVREQRFVWEKGNKAMLLPWADVHHINGVKDDNRIENLQAMMHREHTRLECLRLNPWRWRCKQKPMRSANDDDTSDDSDTSLL